MRRPGNPLALAVLALLYERAMHPYEMSNTLKYRRKEDSIKINYGSLYAVVESLEKRALITAVERTREGRRPERTTYALTDLGREMLDTWLGELIAQPSRQFTDFEAALSLIVAIPPDQARSLLEARLVALAGESAEYDEVRKTYPQFPRLFTVESEYRAALRSAEADFVRELLAEIADGSMSGMPIWLRFHELKEAGAGDVVAEDLVAEFDSTWLPPDRP